MDLVVRARRLPRPGETLAGGPFQTFHGGKGGNQAVAAARLGASVAMVGRVGDDAYGAELRRGLAAEGVGDAEVRPVPGCPSGVALITVDDAGENTIVVTPGANAWLLPQDLAPESGAARAIQEAAWLIAQLEVPLDTVLQAARLAHAAGTRFLLNAAPASQLPEALLSLIDVLVVNRVEAAAVLERSRVGAPSGLARALRRLGPRAAAVTLGDQGALFCDGARVLRQDAFAVETVDAVGAGDAFTAALAVALLESQAPAEALCFACAAGALATTRAGARTSLPRRAEVDALLRR
ncbi:MAG: ribokinase [Planctomycetes bacterium]|nr:ribokinase [Planctomycetota bacterium]